MLAFATAIFTGEPSSAMSNVERQMLALGIVDEVTTPEKLGLGYLSQQPIQIARSSELMDSIKRVNEGLSQLPEDAILTFPAGTNSPIRIRQISANDKDNRNHSNYEYEGFVNNQGQSRDFSARDGSDMTNTEYENNGNIVVNPTSQQILVADARHLFFQVKRTPAFHIIFKHRSTKRRFLVRNVNANAVCRDLINAALTGEIQNMSTKEFIPPMLIG